VFQVQQWAVVAGLGDTNGWQYCTTFSPRNTDWYEKPTRFSFCKRRFWRRKLKVIANSADSAGASVEANSGLPTYDGSRPIRVGWLSKRGLHNKAFRTRYFVLWPRALVRQASFGLCQHNPWKAIEHTILPLNGYEQVFFTTVYTACQKRIPF